MKWELKTTSFLAPTILSLKLCKVRRSVCVQQARLTAKRLHPLTVAEQKDVDGCLSKELEARDGCQSMGASQSIPIDFEVN